MRILDVGVGDGGFGEILDLFPKSRNIKTSWLYEYGGLYAYGIDKDEKSIEKARNRINNGTQLLVMNAQDTSFSNGFFHVIHMNDVLSYSVNNFFLVREMKRILSDNGIILVKETVNNLKFFMDALPLRFLFGKYKDKIDMFQTDVYLNDLREAGFKITSTEYFWYFEIGKWTNLWLCGEIGTILKLIRLDRVFCRRLVATAIKS